MKAGKVNKQFLIIVLILSIIGFITFYSASLSLIAKDQSLEFALGKQGISLILGFILMYICFKIPIPFFKRYHWLLMAGAIVLNLLVLIPEIALNHGGATRWLSIGGMTFQPSELLKFAYIISLSSILSTKTLDSFRKVIVNFILPSLPVAFILSFVQSDHDTLFVILFTGIVILFVYGVKLRYILYLLLIGALAFSVIAMNRPYIKQRIMTYVYPEKVDSNARYQIKQSLIAIGAGGFWGRGLGQSVQKFSYLPEPTNDSIFAVGAEEFGFVGTSILILVYILFAMFGFRIASKSHDNFSRLVASGLVILVVTESFMNISAMLGLIPLSGMPLLFVSHGGSALIVVLAEMGIILNVSKHIRKQ